MRQLLYCVLSDSGSASSTVIDVVGVEGRGVTFVRGDGLAAAVSAIEPVDLIATLRRLVDYENVVENLFGRFTVLPMRFGASFTSEAEVARYLQGHSHRLVALLRELDGCAEMGIRVLLLDENRPVAGPPAWQPQSQAAATYPRSGRAYLEQLRSRFEDADPLRTRREAAIEQCSRALAGIAVRQKSELSSNEVAGFERLLASLGTGETAATWRKGARLLGSIHFLVKRELVATFQQRFRGVRPEKGTELLISGPWPPYNFVASEPARQIPCMPDGTAT